MQPAETNAKTLYNIGLHYQTNPRQDAEHFVFQAVDYVLDEDKDVLVIYNQQDEIIARFAWSLVSMFTRDEVQVAVPETSAPQVSEEDFRQVLKTTKKLYEDVELKRIQCPEGFYQLYVDCYGDVQILEDLEAKDLDQIVLPKSSWWFYSAHGDEQGWLGEDMEESVRLALESRLFFYHEREKIYGPSAWPRG